MPERTELKNLKSKYDDQYPLIKLQFEKGAIKIDRKGDATTDMTISYQFSKKEGNWIYEKCELFHFNGEIDPYDLSAVIGPTIDNFTYFIWN